ncbi:hypothetical protein ACLESD_12545 [Pyxidicoccus sp. 3LFB2]
MLRAGLVFVMLSLSLVACGVGPEELETAQDESAVVSPEAAGSLETQEQNLCEPGPSSNWCQNVDGKACSTTVNRRCYIPNYCEWLFCRCTGGIWVCE